MKIADVERLIVDINESWELALRMAGVNPATIVDCRTTVDDAITNNAMLECEDDE